MLEEELKNLGFSKNEAKVYLALFELGKCRAGKIIDHTGLHRNLVYTALDDLVDKKLASKLEKGKVAVFEPNSPEIIEEMLESKLEKAKETVAEIKKISDVKPRDIKIYEGIEGIKATREPVAKNITAGEKYYIMGVSGKNSDNKELNKYFLKLNKKIINKGGDIRVLSTGGDDKTVITDRGLTLGENARHMPFDVESPMWMTMFRDVFNINIVGESPVTFSIRSQEAAEGFKNYFEFFWRQSVRVESGLEAVEKAIYDMLDELNPGEEYCVMGASIGYQRAPEIASMYDKYHTKRIEKGVVVNMLAHADAYDGIVERNHKNGDPEDKVSHIKKFITAPLTPMQVNTYHNKCFFILYGKDPAVIHFEQPEISRVFKNYFDSYWNQDTYVLKGIGAIRDIWVESVDYDELRFIGARGYFIDESSKMWKEVQEKIKLNKNYKIKNIVDSGVRGHEITKLPYAKTKYLLSANKNPNCVWLYGNKVAISNWAEKEPVLFVSENKALVQSYNDYFDELWNKNNINLQGDNAFKELCDLVLEHENEKLYVIGANGLIWKDNKEQFEKFNLKRVKNKIKILRLDAFNRYKNKPDDYLYAEAKRLPKGFEGSMVIWIFGDHVATIVWGKPTTIFVVKDSEVAKHYLKYYQALEKLSSNY